MLKVYQSPSLVTLDKLCEKIDFEKETLILSNLRSKKEIQSRLIKNKGYHLSESVMRASDFWRLLLRRYHPHKRLISSDYAKMVIAHWLRQQNSSSDSSVEKMNENLTSTLYQMLIQVSPFFLRRENESPLEEWLDEHKDIKSRLDPWFKQIKKITEYFVDKNLILVEMIPSLLLDDFGLEKKWNRNLWIDLGSELSLAEAEIFQALSRSNQINVIAPQPTWKSQYEYLLRPYEYLANQSHEICEIETQPKITTNRMQTVKLSNRLAEIKNAVGLIRGWLDSGVPATRISVVSAQIETYWPVLNSFLEVEGLPAQKDLVVRLMSLPAVLHWISTLKSKARGLSSSDLEYAFYGSEEQFDLAYEKFTSIFKNIYNEQDLLRLQDVKKWFFEDMRSNASLLRDQFVIFALRCWTDENAKPDLEIILRELVVHTSANDNFLFSDWISYIEKIAVQKEKQIKSGDDNGIEITQIMSGHGSDCTHRIFLGLCEEDFASSSHHFFNFQDRLQLSKDLGFQIEHPEQNFRSFQLDWLLGANVQENILSFGLTHFDGQLMNPLSQWVKLRKINAAESALEVEIPLGHRWEQLAKFPIEQVLGKERNLSNDEISLLTNRIKIDNGEVAEKAIAPLGLKVSPSSLESYLRCPFVFKSERVYRLLSLAEADMDIDPRPHGSFVHRMFEKILENKDLNFWNENLLSALVDSIRQEQGAYFFDNDFWQAQKRQFILLANKFIEFEIKWKKEHPEVQTSHRELQWKFYFDTTSGKFLKANHNKSNAANEKSLVLLSGKIDRVDSYHKNQKIIIDYKSSSAELVSFVKWIEKNQLQLLFYMWVLEKGFVDGDQHEVVAAVYYVFKNFQRDQGFRLDTVADSVVGKTKKTTNSSSDNKNKLLLDFEELLVKNITKIASGNFPAKPADLKTCENCHWSLVCRAPHLN